MTSADIENASARYIRITLEWYIIIIVTFIINSLLKPLTGVGLDHSENISNIN